MSTLPIPCRSCTMSPKLPEDLDEVLRPIFDVLPIEQAMMPLVGASDAHREAMEMVQNIVQTPLLIARPKLVAGLWLYVDQLDASHVVSQSITTPSGSFWHAMMHRREGDFANSHYWYRKVGKHPAMTKIFLAGGCAGAGTDNGRYDPHAFVDAVEVAHTQHDDAGKAHPELRAMQRHEWVALFEWCAEH